MNTLRAPFCKFNGIRRLRKIVTGTVWRYGTAGRQSLDAITISKHMFSNRPDPFARRPNKVCDPYGQAGKPLSLEAAKKYMVTLNGEWVLESDATSDNSNANDVIATGLTREFIHADFLSGSRFVAQIGAVAQMNNHFPSMLLERRIVSKKKVWQVVTRVHCNTLVLGGLSTHDFHLAMMIDVEAERPEVRENLLC